MNWVAVDCEIADDPKTRAVAKGAGLTLNETVGAVVRVLGKMRGKAPKGSLAPFDNAMLNGWSGYPDDHQFAAHFVAQFCNKNRVVCAWKKYNGRMIEKNKNDVKRMRKYREHKRLERLGVTRNVTRTKRARSRSPNPTQPNPLRVGVGEGGSGVLASGDAHPDATGGRNTTVLALPRPVVDPEQVKTARAEFDAVFRKATLDEASA